MNFLDRPAIHRLIFLPCRTKRYFVPWWNQDYLNDYWNLTQRKPNTYEMWDEQWKKSDLPKQLKALDLERLPDHLRFRKNNRLYPIKYRHETSVDYKRRLFGVYGRNSGVNVNELLFELNNIPDFDEEVDIKAHIEESKIYKKEKQERILAKMREIEKNLERLPLELEKYERRLKKEEEVKLKALRSEQELLDMAKEAYGYTLNKRDDKFVAFKEKIQAERKEMKKMQRKSR